jgi:pilus assembly protein CpaB
VLVAARPVNAREAISPTMVQVQMRPANAVDPGAYASLNQVVGDVALADIPAGAALTSSNVARASMMPEPFHLSYGMRAMSIAVDEVKDVSGLIQPGDHVDVYAVTARMGNAPSHAFAILRDVVVLGVGGEVNTSGATPGPQGAQWRSVTLQVSAQQAKVLAIADLNATLRLALRPPGEPLRSEPVDAFNAPGGGSSPMVPIVPPVAVQPPPSTGAMPPPKSDPPVEHSIGGSVQFILGDRVEGGANR